MPWRCSVRQSIHEYYLNQLKAIATRSTCVRRNVAAIITDERGHVLSQGFNGVPSDYPHCIDLPCPGAKDKSGDTSRCMAVHAEQNAIMQCTKPDRAHHMYVSNVPCFVCSKMIANFNIKCLWCANDYPDHKGLEVLLDLGITVFVAGEEWVKDAEGLCHPGSKS